MTFFLQITIRSIMHGILGTIILGAIIFLGVHLAKYYKTKERQKISKLYSKAVRYIKKGDFDTALEYLKKALENISKIRDKNNIEAANAMIKIALVYKIKEKYQESKSWYKKALLIKEAAYGSNHKDVLGLREDIKVIKEVIKSKR